MTEQSHRMSIYPKDSTGANSAAVSPTPIYERAVPKAVRQI